MGIKYVRILCRLNTWDFDIWNHSLVEARYTHVRGNNGYCTSKKQVYHMSNIILRNDFSCLVASPQYYAKYGAYNAVWILLVAD